ncbi:hypothetical protein HZB00_01740 [Candidatus Woesearchaeota archaeon]|nr:hypothetical protein [Candidatus Woesearchaeota archaeon]
MKNEEISLLHDLRQGASRFARAGLEFTRYSVESFYACIATPFRIPPFLRRLDTKETMLQRDIEITSPVEYGFLIGTSAFCFATYQGIDYAITQAANGDYTPVLTAAATWAFTNTGSDAYEKYRAAHEKKKSLEEIALDPEQAE